jgi:DNA-directed RNA polymerase beta' subunit
MEMNIHVPQSLQTRNELVQLASVPTQILTPKDSKPIVSVVQDVALGVYRLTKSIVVLSEKQMFNLMCTNPKFFGRVPKPMYDANGVQKWSGRQLLSTIIPPNVNFKGVNNSYDDRNGKNEENFVKIECGEIVQGRVDTKVYQDRSRGLIHSIYNEYGPTETQTFFDNTQQLICNWLVLSGFSVGISDLVVDPTTMKSLNDNIHNMKVKVYDIIREVHQNNFTNDTRKSNTDKFEEEVNKILNEAIKESGKVGLQKIDDINNRMINMIKAGSKGNSPNISQMIACLGQQNVDGKRIAYGFDNRTLPHYNKYDDGPESRGFVENSFIKGLTPQEFFFHSMGGREGLIDTAVKSVTAETAIIIIEDGVAKRVQIGPWIDNQLDHAPFGAVEWYEQRNLELKNLDYGKVWIPTTDHNGDVTWGPVTAITRHDPGDMLYKVRTRSGRSVIVTESKSLLVWKPDLAEFHETPTPDIQIGDALPVTVSLEDPPTMVRHVGNHTLDRQTGVLLGRYLSKCGLANAALSHHLEGLCTSPNDIPSAIYVAPKEFVAGVVAGFLTGNPCNVISRKVVRAVCASQELAEAMAMMMTRFGIFAVISDNAITVVHPWASRVVDMFAFDPTEDSTEGACKSNVTIYRQHNDVVLDPIVSIEQVSIEKYPKVYDLTIPTTLNFGLANGLQVRDTSQTGYIQRKLVKAMEDCKVNFDMTVRNANGNIIQFLYGEDGMDAIKIESQPLPYITMRPHQLEEAYLISPKDDLSTVMAPDKFKSFVAKHPMYHTRCWEHFKQLLEDREFLIKVIFRGEQETSVMYPISFVRIINNTHAMYAKYKCDGVMTDLDPIYVLDEIDKLVEQLQVSKTSPGVKLFRILLRANMSPKQMIIKNGFTRSAFDQIIQMVKMRFYDSIVNPSEMVGVLAAQSIGEPLSQLTLNTFHLSGISSASKAVRGVPRIEELTRVTKNVKAPSMLVYLKPEYKMDDERCKELKNMIETTFFKDVVKTSKIYYEPNDLSTTIEDDAKIIELYKTYNLMSDSNDCDRTLSPWLLRLDIDKGKLLDMDLTMIDLNIALKCHFGDRLSCTFADDSACNLVFRIKLYMDESESASDTLTDLKALESTILEHVIIKGVDKVNKVEFQKKNDMFVYSDDTQSFEKASECYLDTDGTNLQAVLGLPLVDATRTVCNDVNEIYRLFGIEAARQCLYNELFLVIKDQANINYRHISILVDTMTTKGALMSIDRHGINKGDIGPLAKCSFEEVNDVLVKAGVFAEFDKINGVSANIMLGQIAPCGTGDTEVLIDELLLMSGGKHTKQSKRHASRDQDDLLGDPDACDNDPCLVENLTFDFEMPSADPTIQKIQVDNPF